MARRIPDAVRPVEVELPAELAVFDFETWTRPEDEGGPLVDDFGPLAVFIAAVDRWGAAVDGWGVDRGLTRREVRGLVVRAPSWPLDYLGRT